MGKKLISVIVPCYCEEEAIPHYWEETAKVADSMTEVDFEFLFIDDGSKDHTVSILRRLAKSDKRVRYVSFSRNFGKEAAMYAGLKNAKGDYVAIMDVDLQDPPSLLPDMLHAIEKEGYDCAATRRVTRKGEPPIRSFFARMFYRVMRKISKTEVVDGARDYRLMKRKMVNAILDVGEYNRFSKGIFGWVGFKTYWLPYENVERVAGETKWNFWKLFKYAIDGIINFSQVPLSIASWLGIFMTVCSVLSLIFIIVRKLIWGDPVDGWASTICVIIFIGGIQMLCLGIIGQYLAKTYMESKHRPHYIIAESNRDDIKKVK